MYEQEFPQDEGLIYLNHAAVAPWPLRTVRAVQQFADENARRGACNYPAWLGVEAAVREQLRALLNAESSAEIALQKNTSEALSIVAHGLDWRRGDNVVLASLEFPSNRIVWESLARYGVAAHVIPINPDEPDPESKLLEHCDAHTRLLAVSSVQYAAGLRMDLERLGAACKARGILLGIDAIQSLGALRFDLRRCDADFVAADAHKWLLGPEGIGVFYCSPALRERIALHEYGWHMVAEPGDYERASWEVAQDARRFECGSPNMLGIHALHASLSLLQEVGMAAVERGVLENSAYLMRHLQNQPGVVLQTPDTPGRYAGIVNFRVQGMPAARLHEALREAGVVCAVRSGGVRFSPHFYTPRARLDRALDRVATLSRGRRVPGERT